MQPLLFSVRVAKERGRPFWKRVGSDILYFKNHFSRGTSSHHHTLSFTVEFQHSRDVCYLAYHFPYTYTRLLVSFP